MPPRASRTASASRRRIPTCISPRRSTAGSTAWRIREKAAPPCHLLPRTLGEALEALRKDKALRDGIGETFVDYYLRIKEAEIARFNLEVSEWEHREYFDLY
jgi:glutamine synthetase